MESNVILGNAELRSPNRAERPHPEDTPGRDAYPVPEAAARLGIGTTKLRELIASGELRAIRAGRRVVVPRREIKKYIRRQLGEEA
jgi:excisionase family DNA binding protein